LLWLFHLITQTIQHYRTGQNLPTIQSSKTRSAIHRPLGRQVRVNGGLQTMKALSFHHRILKSGLAQQTV